MAEPAALARPSAPPPPLRCPRRRVACCPAAVFNVFEGCVAELFIVDRDELAPAAVTARLAKALGNDAVTLI